MAFEKANYRDVTHSAPNSLGSVIGNQALLNSVDIDKSSCIQLYKFMPYVYSNRAPFKWTGDLMLRFELARKFAIDKLENAIIILCSKHGSKAKKISEVLQEVLIILNSDTLSVFPLLPNSALLGASCYGIYEISIRINSNIYDLAKTFIHEALHILGAWYDNVEYEEEELGECLPVTKVRKELRPNEEYCPNTENASAAYRKVDSIDPLETSPDYLAQYVMKC